MKRFVFVVLFSILVLPAVGESASVDINGDEIVNLMDIARVGMYWGQPGCGSCGGADLTGDGDVDLDDLGELAAQWLVHIEPPAGPVGAWMFDDGTADDSSGNGHDGTLVGDAQIIEDVERDNILSLDGYGDYLKINDNISSFLEKTLTVSVWIKPNSLDQTRVILDKSGVFSYKLVDGKQQFDATGKGAYFSSSMVTVGTWQHLAVIFVGNSNVKFYRNGSLINQTGYAASLNTSTDSTRIGCDSNGNYYFDGMMDDVRVYDYALSDEQISELAKKDYYVIFGTVADVDSIYDMNNVTMTGLPGNPVTDAEGNYSATVAYGWSGTVVPTKIGFTFTPSSRIYSDITEDKNDPYVAAVTRFTLSGNAELEDAIFLDLPGEPTTDGNGDYTCHVDYGWSGVVSPEKDGYTFAPTERSYENVISNLTGQDYTPTINTYTISGSVGPFEDVEMTGLPGSPTTDETGFYSSTVEYGWSGTVTPVKTGCAFVPAKKIYNNISEDQSDQDYTTITDASLVGWWPLNDDVNDYSGSGHNGMIHGSAKVIDDTTRGNVLALDGIDSYISIPSFIYTSQTTYNCTLSFWFNAEQETRYLPYMFSHGPMFNQYNFDTYMRTTDDTSPGAITTRIQTKSGTTSSDRLQKTSSGRYDDSRWHMFVATKAGSTLSVYLDGQLNWTDSIPTPDGPISPTGYDILLGAKKNADTGIIERFFNGMLDDVRLYNKVLSGNEIYGLYTASYEALNPSPVNGAKNVSVNTILSWTAGYLASDVNGHDVYFGTSWADVNEANEAIHIGLQSDTTFDPGTLQGGITYFWRVDEVNEVYAKSPWKGNVWSFTTIDPYLIGWWPFSGDADDHSGYGNDGTVTGAEFVYSSGKDIVLDFEGDDNVTIPAAAFNSVSDKVSIALWQYGDSAIQPQDDSIFFAADDAGNRVIQVHLPWGSGSVVFDAGNSGSSYDRISQSATPDQYEGKWNYWVFTKDATAGEMKMYLNGSLWKSTTGKTRTMTGITQFNIGSKYDGTNNYDGMISDFRIYNKVLSQTEVANFFESSQVYKATKPVPADGTQNVPTDMVLNWTPGYMVSKVNGHDVYFGTNFDDVNDGAPAVHMGLQSDTTFDPGVLDFNTVYYWVVDEVNSLNEESPWLGNVWSFKTWAENDLPTMPTDVQNTNTQLMLGNRRGVVFPISWPEVGCDYTYEQCLSGAEALSDLYYDWSRGKVQMVFSSDGTGDSYQVYHPDDCTVPYAKISSNESDAQQYLIAEYGIPSTHIKWFIQSGNSTANAGGTTCDTRSPQTFTISHEMGHLFRLGHGCELEYNSDGTFYQNDRYGDRTSNMGRSGAGGFNLPQLHRLKWIDEDEVAVFQREDSGTVYRIRDIHLYEDVNLAGVVYYLPHTGNRLWIALTNKSTNNNDYLGSDYALSKYVMGWHNSSNMEETICITQFAGEHTDDFGLTYELVALNTSEKWADIRITYNPANEKRVLPLLFNQTQRLLQASADGVRGQMEVTIEITNPNLATTIPFVNQKDKLTVENSYSVTEQTGLTNILPGSTTNTAVFVVKSAKGPLSSEEAHLTGSYKIAHRLPFEFNIDFE